MCIVQVYASKLPRWSHTQSNWKGIPEFVDCDISKRMCNCCLSASMQSRNLFNKKKAIINIITHIITALSVLHWKGKSVRKAGISFIFACFIIRCHSILQVLCSNLTANKHFICENTQFKNIFCKVYQLHKTLTGMLTVKMTVFET